MRSLLRLCVALTAFMVVFVGCSQRKEEPKMSEAKSPADSLAAKIRRFAPTDIAADTSRLSDGDRKALDKLVEAAKLFDPLFLSQVWSGNMINKGPWSRLDKNEPFIEGVPPKPPQAGFYPDDMTKDEFNSWLATLSEQDRQRATGFFTVIRRGADGKLKIVPYHEEYREFLEPAAKLLKEAADLTANQTLKNFLTKRADAFLSDDYYASDVAWIRVQSCV